MSINIREYVVQRRMSMRILVVEDEQDLREAICEGLEMDGYAVDCIGDGFQAYEMISVEEYDLVILDLNLPGMDGMDLLEKVRPLFPDLKILILSARSSVSDKVKGLDSGADDYLAKPFHFEELEARIRTLLRKKYSAPLSIIDLCGIRLDLSKRTASVQGTILPLTHKEFGILEYFMLNPEAVISQENLIEHVWNADVNSFSGAVRVHISSLRKKLRAALGSDPIETRIGEGYIFHCPPESDTEVPERTEQSGKQDSDR